MTNLKTTRDEATLLLLTLAELSRLNLTHDVGALAHRLSWGVGRVLRVLTHLESRGLADRTHARLTLLGLGIAVALRGATPSTRPDAMPSTQADKAPATRTEATDHSRAA